MKHKKETLVGKVGALSGPTRSEVKPLLDVIVHDLTGSCSVIAMEGYAVERLAASLEQATKGGRMSADAQKMLKNLHAAAINLRQASDAAATYLAALDDLADGRE